MGVTFRVGVVVVEDAGETGKGDKIEEGAVPSGSASVEEEGEGEVGCGEVASTSNGGTPERSGEGGVGVPIFVCVGVPMVAGEVPGEAISAAEGEKVVRTGAVTSVVEVEA